MSLLIQRDTWVTSRRRGKKQPMQLRFTNAHHREKWRMASGTFHDCHWCVPWSRCECVSLAGGTQRRILLSELKTLKRKGKKRTTAGLLGAGWVKRTVVKSPNQSETIAMVINYHDDDCPFPQSSGTDWRQKYVEPGPFLPMSSCLITYTKHQHPEIISTFTQLLCMWLISFQWKACAHNQ